MQRIIIILSALAVLAAPAAAVAKPSKADKREAQKECRAERDASSEAFGDTYRNFGACVSQKAREAKAERKQAKANAARECRAERDADREAFEEEHGTNANNRNAFGKCVSQRAKAKRAEQDAEDAEEVQEIESAAQVCKAERAADRQAFEEQYGTNANKRNAFGKCVSQKAREDD